MKFWSEIVQSQWKIGAIVSLAFFCLYLFTAPQTNVSYADSDVLITVGYHLGIAHPPGYSLYSLLVFLVTHLPIPGTVAFKAHLLSAVLHSLTLLFLYAAVWHLVSYFREKTKKTLLPKPLERWLISTVSVGMLGGSFLFWTYSIVAEKYALNDLFAALIIFCVITIYTQKEIHFKKYWLFLSATVGLALGYHQTIVLLLPMLLVFAFLKRSSLKPYVIPVVLTAGAVFLVHISLLLALNSRQVPVSWRFESTKQGIYNELTRKELSGYMVVSGKQRGMYLNEISLEEIEQKVPVVLGLFKDFFGLPACLLVFLGLFYLIKQKRKDQVLLGSLFLFTTVFIPLYVEWPQDLSGQSIQIRQHLLSYIGIPLFISLGLMYLLSLLNTSSLAKMNRSLVRIGVTTGALASVVWHIQAMYPQVSLRHFDFVNRFYTHILSEVPSNTLLACNSDVSCFALLYLQKVENIRPDVVIVPHMYRFVEDDLNRHQDIKGFAYKHNPELFLDYLTFNQGKRPVMMVDFQKVYYDLLGMDYGFFTYVPYEGYGEITRESAAISTIPQQYSKELSSIQFAAFDHMRQQLKAAMAQRHRLNVMILARMGKQQKALTDQEIRQADILSSNLPVTYQHANDLSGAFALNTTTYALFASVDRKQRNVDDLIEAGDFFLEAGDVDRAIFGYQSALNFMPLNKSARLKLAQLYEQKDRTQKALSEYQNILIYYPENQEARDGVDRLTN